VLNSKAKQDAMKFSRILIPVTSTQADEEAIRLACRLASPDKSDIHVIHIITMKRDLPLDAEIEPAIHKAEDILSHMERVAREQNYKITTEVLQAREVGPAIVNEAAEREVDLILMGVAYKMRFGEFSLGEIVPYVLKNGPCRIMLYQSCYTIPSTPYQNE
jgi:nucleotide-binding universal stress UspA family protein